MMNLGKCLKAYRQLNDLSVKDVATRIGQIGTSPLIRLERGEEVQAGALRAVLCWLLSEDYGAAPGGEEGGGGA
jgi:transcriptional regulator with XRE-family HTH domain